MKGNLLCCLIEGISTSNCLSCEDIGTGELGLEVSLAAWLLLSGSILLASGEATGVLGTVAGLAGVSGSGLVDIVGCSGVLQIPWLFLEGLQDPVVTFMLVTSLLISLHDAIVIVELHCRTWAFTVRYKVKLGSIFEFDWLLSICWPIKLYLLLFELIESTSFLLC